MRRIGSEQGAGRAVRVTRPSRSVAETAFEQIEVGLPLADREAGKLEEGPVDHRVRVGVGGSTDMLAACGINVSIEEGASGSIGRTEARIHKTRGTGHEGADPGLVGMEWLIVEIELTAGKRAIIRPCTEREVGPDVATYFGADAVGSRYSEKSFAVDVASPHSERTQRPVAVGTRLGDHRNAEQCERAEKKNLSDAGTSHRARARARAWLSGCHSPTAHDQAPDMHRVSATRHAKSGIGLVP